jgi:hypothetical protein
MSTSIEAVIRFDQDGTGSAFYTEAIDLSELGRLEITRATKIEFNNTRQLWEVFNFTNNLVFEHTSRQTCLDWEHQQYNQPLTM